MTLAAPTVAPESEAGLSRSLRDTRKRAWPSEGLTGPLRCADAADPEVGHARLARLSAPGATTLRLPCSIVRAEKIVSVERNATEHLIEAEAEAAALGAAVGPPTGLRRRH